jgi:hypothetical protein
MNYESYEDLNNAKKRIMSLLKTKYVNEEYQESNDTDADVMMNKIINLINNVTTHAFQMIPFVKKNADRIDPNAVIGTELVVDKNGNQVFDKKTGLPKYKNIRGELFIQGASYFRNVTSQLAFNQNVLSISNLLTNVNRIFIKLINDIGYVEPHTMDLYKQAFDKYIPVYYQLINVAADDGQLKITVKDGEQNEFDRNLLIREFDNAMKEHQELEKFNNVIKHTYNYVSAKKKNHTFNDNNNKSQILTNYDDDL